MGSWPRLVLTSSPQCAVKFLASMSLPRLFPQSRKPFPISHMKILLKPPNIDLEAIISIARAESLFLAVTPTAPGHTALTTPHTPPHVKTLMSYVHPPFPSSHSHLLRCEILKAGTNSYSSLDPLPALGSVWHRDVLSEYLYNQMDAQMCNTCPYGRILWSLQPGPTESLVPALAAVPLPWAITMYVLGSLRPTNLPQLLARECEFPKVVMTPDLSLCAQHRPQHGNDKWMKSINDNKLIYVDNC